MEQLDPKKLEQARIAKGLKPGEAAERAKISQPALSNYESGYARPQPHILAALCRVYDVANPLDLYSEVENPDVFSIRKKLQLS